MLDIEGSIITVDVMGYQYKIANQIVRNKADYMLALKGNQGEFHDDIIFFLDTHLTKDLTGISYVKTQDMEGDYSCIEQRQLWLVNDIHWLLERHLSDPRWAVSQLWSF
ncbi:conserved protein of unknown function [Xenorhabdus poinarii G6]|uniref:Transposase n=1 Tax=Xenorhabdus poinarii G6 TaxID=1354304 RepID=A0A068R3H1_9GAMM|nr:conserved protein of unknown function [Xenorhabdus poinarii G6]